MVDQTRGILTWINEASPGAYHSSIQYTTIAGKFVQVSRPPLLPIRPLSAHGQAATRLRCDGRVHCCSWHAGI